MGVIIRNGIEYSGAGMGGGSCDCDEIVYLTQEEYDALPESKLTDGVEYRITDANTDSTKARNITYDNTESGIEATSVQGAIDKLAGGSKFVYSTEETICGTWIDGKPLYRKVITNIEFSHGTTNYEHLISDIEHIYIPEWYLRYSDYSTACNYHITNIQVDNTKVSITADNWGNTLHVVLHYTKTTD